MLANHAVLPSEGSGGAGRGDETHLDGSTIVVRVPFD